MSIIRRKPLYFVIPLVVIVFLLPIFKMEYATDTYYLESHGFFVTVDHMLNNNGRPIIAAFLALFGAMELSVCAFYYFSLFLGIVSASVAIYRLYGILKNNMSQACALFFGIFTVLTPFTTDYFMFIEKGFFMLAICMSIVAFEGYLMILKGNKKGFIPALVGIVVSFFTYQIIPGAFAVLSTLFALLYSKEIKRLVINLLIALGIYGFGAVGSVLFLKLFTDSNRVSTGINFEYMLKSFLFLGTGTVYVYIGAVTLLFVICATVNKARGNRIFSRETGVDFLKALLVLLVGLMAMIVPFAFSEGEEVWLPFRISYPISVMAIAVAIYFCYKENYESGAEKCSFTTKAKRVGAIVMGTVLFLNLVFFHAVFISRLINNARDEELALKIGAEIEKYEAEGNKTVKYIKIYHDKNPTNRNEGIFKIGDTNVRAFATSWSDVNHLNVILEKSYLKKNPDQKIFNQYFKGKNWDSFSTEQLVFDGEVLHICVY